MTDPAPCTLCGLQYPGWCAADKWTYDNVVVDPNYIRGPPLTEADCTDTLAGRPTLVRTNTGQIYVADPRYSDKKDYGVETFAEIRKGEPSVFLDHVARLRQIH